MTRPIRLLFACLLLIAALPAFAAVTQIHTFDLRHRTAEEMIPLVRPLLDPEGAVSGSGQTLVIRSTLQNLADLEAAIAALDTPRRQLMITVRQGAQEQVVRRGGSISGEVGSGDIAMEVGEGDPGGRVRIYSTHGRSDERIDQQVRVTEGGWALIQAGEAVPIAQQNVSVGPAGTSVQQSVQYRDVRTGFEVRPRLTGGDEVALDIRPFRQRRSPDGGGIIDQQTVTTTVRGRLGEWIVLGGGTDTRLDNRRGIIYSTEAEDELTHRVYVRVDPVGN